MKMRLANITCGHFHAATGVETQVHNPSHTSVRLLFSSMGIKLNAANSSDRPSMYIESRLPCNFYFEYPLIHALILFFPCLASYFHTLGPPDKYSEHILGQNIYKMWPALTSDWVLRCATLTHEAIRKGPDQ